MIALVHQLCIFLATGSMDAYLITQTDEARHFIECEPVLHAVAQPLDDGLGVNAKSIYGGTVEPTPTLRVPGIFEYLWQVPVEKRYPGRDALVEQGINEPVVEVKTFLIDFSPTLRDNARPGHR